jgi:hypothetical protein
VRAIALGLEHLRAIDRYGIANSGQQYVGWKQLGSGIPMAAPQMTADAAERLIADTLNHLGVRLAGDGPITIEHVRRDLTGCFRAAARRLHPDQSTGDPDLFRRITEARDLLAALS